MSKNDKTVSRYTALALCFVVAVLYAFKLSHSDRVFLDWLIIVGFTCGFIYNGMHVLRLLFRKNKEMS